ncbi:MAG: 4-(cytidine 5'-diphospho)-2-C-methyl-D-erythritol kinase [Fibrobacteraceae bacterium]
MIQEFAPAKINLFLDILRRRPDGYHDLGTFFQTVNVGDTLRGESDPSGKITLRYNQPQEYPVDSDLVYRAAVLLKTKFSVGMGALLYLEKKLPLGAGLGGGSADASAALRLLNRLWGLGLSPESLEALGTNLGADVPFLVRGGSALAEGIGDRLTHLPAVNLPKGAALLVATPLCAVPTKAAYAGCIPSGNARWETYKASDYASFRGEFFNKFEETVFPQFPLIAQMKGSFLKSGALFALMSGSGASVFAVFGSRERASEVQEALGASARFSAVTDFFPGF